VRVLSRGEGAIRQRHLKKFGVEPKLGTLRSGTKYLLHELRVSSPPRKRALHRLLAFGEGLRRIACLSSLGRGRLSPVLSSVLETSIWPGAPTI
jgi:hypothetical protein